MPPDRPLLPPQAPSTAPIWAIVGPTASGKSALALALARTIGAEIIGADAVQVYRGCTIGSAKPTAQERALVPHHLIDVAAPTAPFDASQFVDAATAAIADIRARGRVPLLCGGTGLYLRALRLGLIDVPKDAALRAELEAADAHQADSSLRRLQQLDPESARSIDPSNGAYLRRALEITLLSGRPASALRAEHARLPEQMPMVLWWVDRSDSAMRARIERRTAAMLDGGLIDEVRGLLRQGVSPHSAALKSLGYREVVATLEGKLAPAQLAQEICKSTWQYVRRQRIWLRREERSPTGHSAPSHRVRRLLLADGDDGGAEAPADGVSTTAEAIARLIALYVTQPQPPAAA